MTNLEVKQFQKIAGILKEENSFGNITNDYDEDMSDDDRFDTLGGDKIKAGIENLMASGFDYREILQFVKDTIASKRNY
jgi:hypothetical protein